MKAKLKRRWRDEFELMSQMHVAVVYKRLGCYYILFRRQERSMTSHQQQFNNLDLPQYHQSDLEPITLIKKLGKQFPPSRFNQTKKPSAFRSNSSHSSKQKHVVFPHQNQPRQRKSSWNQRQKKRYNSYADRGNGSDLSIEDVNTERNQSQEDSRILIHISTHKTMSYENIKAALNSLKRVFKLLKQEVPKMQKSIKDLRNSFSLQLSQKLEIFKTGLRDEYRSEKELLKSNAASLQNELKAKWEQNRQLSRQLESLRLENLKSLQRLKEDASTSKTGSPCSNCKIQQIKISSMREDALQSSKKIAQLSAENESLQERVFDLEQQVIGIDLEVEKKLKAALTSVPTLTQSQLPNSQLIEDLTKTIATLTKRCQRYEELCKSEEELKRRETELDKAIKEYQLKNASLLEGLAKSEEDKELNYQRQHQLLIAEDEISRQLQELRRKQIQLSQWEARLSQNRVEQLNRIPSFKQSNQDGRPLTQEPSMRSLNRSRWDQQQQYYSDYRVVLPQKQGRESQGLNNKNERELSHRSSFPYDQSMKTAENSKIRKDKIKESYYNRQNNGDLLQPDRTHRDAHIRKLNPSYSSKQILDKKLPERIGGAYNKYRQEVRRVEPGFRDRSSSPSHSFRSSNISYGIRTTMQQNKNLMGLENKLDRLRDQLKKQLESIN